MNFHVCSLLYHWVWDPTSFCLAKNNGSLSNISPISIENMQQCFPAWKLKNRKLLSWNFPVYITLSFTAKLLEGFSVPASFPPTLRWADCNQVSSPTTQPRVLIKFTTDFHVTNLYVTWPAGNTCSLPIPSCFKYFFSMASKTLFSRFSYFTSHPSFGWIFTLSLKYWTAPGLSSDPVSTVSQHMVWRCQPDF